MRGAWWGALGLVAGCDGGAVEVVRPLRAVWSPDGQTALQVVSAYRTRQPDQPYFADPGARDFQLSLERLDGSADDPWASAELLQRFAEGVEPGGWPEYEPVYWLPGEEGRERVVYSGRRPRVQVVGERPEALEVPVGRLADALGAADREIAPLLEPLEAVPSPDGLWVATVWYAGLLDDVFGPLRDYRVVAFHDIEDRSVLAATRVSDEVWHNLKVLYPFEPLEDDAHPDVSIVWDRDGSGVFAYLKASETPAGEPVSSTVRFVPVDGSPAYTPPAVPRRPVPTRSGPVDDRGRSFTLEVSGNATVIRLGPFPDAGARERGLPPWVPWDEQPLVPLADWLDAWEGAYNF